ncbi:putative bacteriophage regulatory protein [Lachnospiraceae bacterium KM106-2]|nr:putative bacteriophage regulatory protein [Lachnospiraceae bacterium KM106-2]
MTMSDGRHVSVDAKYKGKNIKTKLAAYLESFVFNDVASGESDSISITLCDKNKKWMGNWFPEKGDDIVPSIILHNWSASGTKKTIKCGKFTIDDLSYSGPPTVCNIGAVSVPSKQGFQNTKHHKVWKNHSIKQIAADIAKKYGLKLSFEDNRNIVIKTIEQSGESDSSFFSSLCSKYGLALKVFNNKICVFNEEIYEKKKPIVTIHPSDFIGQWNYNTTIAGTYTGAKISYTSGKESKDIEVKIGSGSRILEVNEKAESRKDAEYIARGMMKSENRKTTTMSFTIMANAKIYATCCIYVKGLRKLSGKYYVEKVSQNISASEHTMSLTLHKVVS